MGRGGGSDSCFACPGVLGTLVVTAGSASESWSGRAPGVGLGAELEAAGRYPEVLTRSVYQPMRLSKPLFEMSLQERRGLFVGALRGMLRAVEDGRPPAEVAYETSESGRLFSLGLQPMWEVREDKEQSRLVGLESLLALHTGTWGVGLVVDVLEDLLDSDLDVYLQFKGLEVQASGC